MLAITSNNDSGHVDYLALDDYVLIFLNNAQQYGNNIMCYIILSQSTGSMGMFMFFAFWVKIFT